jgi:hypothetical protein
VVDLFDGTGFNVVTLAFTLVSVWIAVHFGQRALRPPERELRVRAHVSPVRNSDQFDVWLYVQVTGRHDIPSTQFDQGRPLTLWTSKPAENIGCRVPGVRMEAEGKIVIGPEFLPRGRMYFVTFVSAGRPMLHVHSSYLIDTAVKLEEVFTGRPGRKQAQPRPFKAGDRAREVLLNREGFGALASLAGLMAGVAGIVLALIITFS